MKLKDTRFSYLLRLVTLLLMLLGLVTSLEITEVSALGFYGDYPTGTDVMGTAVELRPGAETHARIMNDMYSRSQLFADLENRSEPFPYMVTVTVNDDVIDSYTYLFAARMGPDWAYGLNPGNTENSEFIDAYGLNGLVYSADGTFLYHVAPPSSSGWHYWYYRSTFGSEFGTYSISDYDPIGGLVSGTYMIYTNIPSYASDFILSEFSTGDFSGDEDGESGFWASLIGFFTDIWGWLTGFWDNDFFASVTGFFTDTWGWLTNFWGNLTDWFLSILDILWDWLLSFIEFVLGLFIPTDVDSWMDLIYDVRDSLISTTGTLGLSINYMVGILLSISTAPEISVLTVPGEFFGSSIVLNFNSIATNAPAAWSTMVLLIRGIFILSIWPPVIDFFFQILFKDYRSAVIQGMGLRDKEVD